MKDKLLRIVDERKRDFLFIVLSLMLNVAVISISIFHFLQVILYYDVLSQVVIEKVAF